MRSRAWDFWLGVLALSTLAVWSLFTQISQPATCHEDMPCWDCHTMGNLQCGPDPATKTEGKNSKMTPATYAPDLSPRHQPKPLPPEACDILVRGSRRSVMLLHFQTPAAEEWADTEIYPFDWANTEDEGLPDNTVICEPRYADDILQGALAAGLTVYLEGSGQLMSIRNV